MADPPPLEQIIRRGRFLVLRNRRPLAAGLAAIAVLLAVGEAGTPDVTVAEVALQPQPGRLALPVRAADAGVVALLHPGDRVDVLGVLTDGATGVVTSDVSVLRVPEVDAGGGFLSGTAEETLVVLDASPADAVRLAAAQAAGPLTFAIRATSGR